MAQNEPGIPITDGDLPEDPKEIQAKTDPDKNNSDEDKAGEAEKAKQIEKNGEGSLQVSEEQYKSLVEGWKEDREYLMGENKRLRAEAKNPKLTQQEEEELEAIDDPDERAEKKLEFRQKREKAAEEAELKTVKSEIRFYERTNKEFAENKKDILKVASDYECKDLKQAILVWRGLNVGKAKKDAEYHDERKKGADGKGGGNAGGSTAGKPYDPKTDSKKSFGDLYREGLGR
jgi:hypothetical protein